MISTATTARRRTSTNSRRSQSPFFASPLAPNIGHNVFLGDAYTNPSRGPTGQSRHLIIQRRNLRPIVGRRGKPRNFNKSSKNVVPPHHSSDDLPFLSLGYYPVSRSLLFRFPDTACQEEITSQNYSGRVLADSILMMLALTLPLGVYSHYCHMRVAG